MNAGTGDLPMKHGLGCLHPRLSQGQIGGGKRTHLVQLRVLHGREGNGEAGCYDGRHDDALLCSTEWHPVVDHFVEDHAQSPDVGFESNLK